MSHKTDATLRPFLFAFPHCVPRGPLFMLRNDKIIPQRANGTLRAEGASLFPEAKHRIIAYYFVFIVYYNFYYYISKKIFENVCFLLYKTFFIWYYPFITLYYAKLLTR